MRSLTEYFEVALKNDAEGSELVMLCGKQSKINIALCKTASPTLHLSIVVPTLGVSDEGEPHCLEHLIFRGSRQHPVAGFLDNLAMCSMSNYTNAYTMPDRTVYTVSTLGTSGLCRLLPAYMDHVLNPLLRESDFSSEVFHISKEGDNAGVVYSEMESVSTSPIEAASLQLYKQALSRDCPWSRNTGGDTKCLPYLSNEQVKKVHGQFYRQDKLTLLIVGSYESRQLSECLISLEKSLASTLLSPLASPTIATPASQPGSTRILYYQSDDDSSDAVLCLTWRGPEWKDIRTRVALECMAEYLTEGPSAPFLEDLVENLETGIAASVDYQLEDFASTLLTFTFEDCSQDEIRTLHGRALKILEAMTAVSGAFALDMKRMQTIVKRFAWTERNQMECSPAEFLETKIINYVVNCADPRARAQYDPSNILTSAGVCDSLLTEPLTFWLDLIKRWLINSPSYVTICLPSTLASLASSRARDALRRKRGVSSQQNASDASPKSEEVKCDMDPLMPEGNAEGCLIPCHVRGNELLPSCRKGYTASRGCCLSGTSAAAGCNMEKQLQRPLQLVDMRVVDGESESVKNTSKFVEISLLTPLPSALKKMSLSDFLQMPLPQKGRASAKKVKRVIDSLDEDIRGFLEEIRLIDFEKQWQSKVEQIADQRSNMGGDESESRGKVGQPDNGKSRDSKAKAESPEASDTSEWSDEDSEDEDESADLDDFAARALLFVLDEFSVGQFVRCFIKCVFHSGLRVPLKQAESLKNIQTTTEQGKCLVSYKALEAYLDEVTLGVECSMGVDDTDAFDDHLHVNMKSPVATFGDSCEILRKCVEFTEFDPSRFVMLLKSDVNESNQELRGGLYLMRDLAQFVRHPWGSSELYDNMVSQAFLQRIAIKYPEVFAFLAEQIWALLSHDLLSGDCSLHVAADADAFLQNSLPQVLRVFPEFTKLPTTRAAATKTTAKSNALGALPIVTEPRSVSIYSATLESMHMIVGKAVPLSLLSPEAQADTTLRFAHCAYLTIMEEYLSSMSGPLFAPIRDSGTSYGPSFRIYIEDMMAELVLRDSADADKAHEIAIHSLQRLHSSLQRWAEQVDENAECDLLPEKHFTQSRAAAIFSISRQIDTPAAVAQRNLQHWMRGICSKNESHLLEKMIETDYRTFLIKLERLLQTFLHADEGVTVAMRPKTDRAEALKEEDQCSSLKTSDTKTSSQEYFSVTDAVVDTLMKHSKADDAAVSDSSFLHRSLSALLRAPLARLCELSDDNGSYSDEDSFSDE